MKKIMTIGVMLLSMCSFSQELNETTFDFWVGDWELTWTDTNGKTIKGENTIVKILENKVIQENFNDPTNKYTGMSISMFNVTTKTWHQTWMDSGGSYYNFTGSIVDGDPSFKTETIEKKGQKLQQRMVFKDVKEDSFIWIWEGTRDGGESWAVLWKIEYKRK